MGSVGTELVLGVSPLRDFWVKYNMRQGRL